VASFSLSHVSCNARILRPHPRRVYITASLCAGPEMLWALMVAQRIPPGARGVDAKSLGVWYLKDASYGFRCWVLGCCSLGVDAVGGGSFVFGVDGMNPLVADSGIGVSGWDDVDRVSLEGDTCL
jgi:hypothetical protein